MTAAFFPSDLVLRRPDGRPVRSEFPLLAACDVACLDHAASAQKPRAVLEAWRRFRETSCANVHRGACRLSEEVTAAYGAARARVARFLGVPAEGLVFVRGATEGLNLAAHGLLSGRAGIPVALTEIDHHANLVPWHFQGVGEGGRHPLVPVRVRAGPGALDPASLTEAVERAAIVAVPHVSNVTGAVLDLAALGHAASSAGAVLVADGCQALSRGPGPLPPGVAGSRPTRSRRTRPTARRGWARSGSSRAVWRAGRPGPGGWARARDLLVG